MQYRRNMRDIFRNRIGISGTANRDALAVGEFSYRRTAGDGVGV